MGRLDTLSTALTYGCQGSCLQNTNGGVYLTFSHLKRTFDACRVTSWEPQLERKLSGGRENVPVTKLGLMSKLIFFAISPTFQTNLFALKSPLASSPAQINGYVALLPKMLTVKKWAKNSTKIETVHIHLPSNAISKIHMRGTQHCSNIHMWMIVTVLFVIGKIKQKIYH